MSSIGTRPRPRSSRASLRRAHDPLDSQLDMMEADRVQTRTFDMGKVVP